MICCKGFNFFNEFQIQTDKDASQNTANYPFKTGVSKILFFFTRSIFNLRTNRKYV